MASFSSSNQTHRNGSMAYAPSQGFQINANRPFCFIITNSADFIRNQLEVKHVESWWLNLFVVCSSQHDNAIVSNEQSRIRSTCLSLGIQATMMWKVDELIMNWKNNCEHWSIDMLIKHVIQIRLNILLTWHKVQQCQCCFSFPVVVVILVNKRKDELSCYFSYYVFRKWAPLLNNLLCVF